MVKAASHQTRGVLTTAALGPGGQDVLRTRILQPLGLTHTIFPTTAAMPSPHLHGYSVEGGPLTEVNITTNTSCEWTAGS
jgi:D-alanyl-D-alanine carboxypeptidase